MPKGRRRFAPAPLSDGGAGLASQDVGPLLCYLIVVRGGIPGTMLRLAQNASSLGRSADNTFAVHDDTVSRRHAVIAIDALGCGLVDRPGQHQRHVRRREPGPRPGAVRVNDGSRIQLGASTLLKFLKLDACEAGFQREMYERAVRDNLTGLYNRGYFLNQIGPLRDLSAMRELGLAVILIDIDHFKQINDTHGHDAGDLVLGQVAAALREATRPEDLVARYGGEEFVMALPCGSQDQAIERADADSLDPRQPADARLRRRDPDHGQPGRVLHARRTDPGRGRHDLGRRRGPLRGEEGRAGPGRPLAAVDPGLQPMTTSADALVVFSG